jgi:crotonobetainyl-CoA:carnitine CoA-transferase CaiB-like acyl-CoA transferase
VGSLEPQFSKRLLETLGLSNLQKLTMSQKPEHQQELKAAIQEIILLKPLSHWQEAFAQIDACVEPVLTLAEAAEHPQLKARGLVIEVDRGDGEKQKQVAPGIRFQ